jgi:regulator of nucleoside diphosphate kinase
MSYLDLEMPAITITTEDAQHLSLLALSDTPPANSLARGISRANIIPRYQALRGLVRMGSLVTYRDDITCQVHEVTLVYPHETEGDPTRVSVLSPVGTALIGLSVGQVIEFETPYGDNRSLTVMYVWD